VIVFNYLYTLDSKIGDTLSKEMKKDSIIVFDEAHNIDDICLEAYSVDIVYNYFKKFRKYILNRIEDF